MSGRLKLRKIKLGKNADPAKNFILEVPDVEDGTITLFREDGTQVAKFDLQGELLLPTKPMFQGGLGTTTGANYVQSITQEMAVGITMSADSKQLIVPIAGRYRVHAQQLINHTAALYFMIRHNSSPKKYGYRATGMQADLGAFGIFDMVKNDTIDVYYQGTTTGAWGGAHSMITMELIG